MYYHVFDHDDHAKAASLDCVYENNNNIIDNNLDEICHATPNWYHGSSVETKDVMSVKNAGCYSRDSSRVLDNQILIKSLHLYTMCMKRKRGTDGTFPLYEVYWYFF